MMPTHRSSSCLEGRALFVAWLMSAHANFTVPGSGAPNSRGFTSPATIPSTRRLAPGLPGGG